jgi:hypothetical protein
MTQRRHVVSYATLGASEVVDVGSRTHWEVGNDCSETASLEHWHARTATAAVPEEVEGQGTGER